MLTTKTQFWLKHLSPLSQIGYSCIIPSANPVLDCLIFCMELVASLEGWSLARDSLLEGNDWVRMEVTQLHHPLDG